MTPTELHTLIDENVSVHSAVDRISDTRVRDTLHAVVDNIPDTSSLVSKTYVDTGLGTKADASAVTGKADKTYVDTSLNSKLDVSKKPVIATVAGLRALTAPASDVMYQTTDNGGGQWYYDSTDTTSTDNIGTVIVTSDNKRLKRIFTGAVDVKWFGAKGDGVTDDAASIQAGINYLQTNSGGTLYFPKGKYLVNTAILITKNSISILGENSTSALYEGSSIVQGGTTNNCIEVSTTVQSVYGFSIEKIQFTGNISTATAGNGLVIQTTSGNTNVISSVSIVDCAFNNFKESGLVIDGSYYFVFVVNITNCKTSDSKNGVWLKGAVLQCHIDGCYIESNTTLGGYPFKVDGTSPYVPSGILFSRVTFAGSSGVLGGLDITNGNNINVLNGWWEDNNGYQVSLKSCSNVNIQGGTMTQENVQKGIYLGFNTSSDPMYNIRIDSPGWTNSSSNNYIDLAAPAAPIQNVYLGSVAQRSMTSADVTGFATNFPSNSIYFIDEYKSPTFYGTVTSKQFKLSSLNTAPASSGDTGTLGEVRIDGNYIYVCKATNSWVRSALTTW